MAVGKNMRLLALVATFILFPTLLILFLSKAKWVHKSLPYYSADTTAAVPDKYTQTVSTHLSFTDHNGKPFNLKDWDSCIVLVNIFFATCPEVCPEMNTQLQSVAEKINANPKETRIRFLSITIDPDHDSIPVLKEYANRFKADRYHRLFVRCNNSKEALYDWIRKDLFLATDQKGNDFIHSEQVVILDKKKYVRSILPTRGNTLAERLDRIKQIEADIDNLIYEYRQQAIESKKK